MRIFPERLVTALFYFTRNFLHGLFKRGLFPNRPLQQGRPLILTRKFKNIHFVKFIPALTIDEALIRLHHYTIIFSIGTTRMPCAPAVFNCSIMSQKSFSSM